ncbi:MAG: tetratricopeptide repeat protein, partial [Actinomycetota bacterium]
RIANDPLPHTGNPDIDHFFHTTLAKDPTNRPPTVDDFITTLNTVNTSGANPPLALTQKPVLHAAETLVPTGYDSPRPTAAAAIAVAKGIVGRNQGRIAVGAAVVALSAAAAIAAIATGGNGVTDQAPQLVAPTTTPSIPATDGADVRAVEVPAVVGGPVTLPPPTTNGAQATSSEAPAAPTSETIVGTTDEPPPVPGPGPTTVPGPGATSSLTSSPPFTLTILPGPGSSTTSRSTTSTIPDLGPGPDAAARARTLYGEAKDHYDARRYYTALSTVDEALALQPDYVDALILKSSAHRQIGDYTRAIDAAFTAVLLDLSSWEAHFNRGFAYRLSGELQLALNDFDDALALNDLDASTHLQRAITLDQLGRIDAASNAFDRAYELAPSKAHTVWTRANFRGRQGRLTGAENDLERFLVNAGADDSRRSSAEYLLAELKAGRNPF